MLATRLPKEAGEYQRQLGSHRAQNVSHYADCFDGSRATVYNL